MKVEVIDSLSANGLGRLINQFFILNKNVDVKFVSHSEMITPYHNRYENNNRCFTAFIYYEEKEDS